MAFRSVGSPMDEMKFLERMRAQDPESAANVVANGQLLVEYAQQGQLKAIQCALDHIQGDRVLMFYSARMFRAACQNHRVDVLRFMLAHGFDVTQVGMRDILHCVIDEIADDVQHADDAAQPLLRFLIEAGVDVNWQRATDLFTALHVACQKNLYAIAYLLILYGADVNAIAMNDEMPLTCAVVPNEATHYALTQHALLVSLLEEHNVRRTWRKSRKPSEVSSDAAIAATKGSRGNDAVVIRSFSGSCSALQHVEAQRSAETLVYDSRTLVTAPEDAPLAAIACATAGITLDTPLKKIRKPLWLATNAFVPGQRTRQQSREKVPRGPAFPAKENNEKSRRGARSKEGEALRPHPPCTRARLTCPESPSASRPRSE
ncbi:Ankyrin repeat-containing domain, partial [Globisporangium splendens]